jgi:hypothetical protein
MTQSKFIMFVTQLFLKITNLIHKRLKRVGTMKNCSDIIINYFTLYHKKAFIFIFIFIEHVLCQNNTIDMLLIKTIHLYRSTYLLNCMFKNPPIH